MKLTEEEWDTLAKGILKDIDRKGLCVNPQNQTFDCVSCAVCQFEFLRRVRNDLEGVEPFRPL